MIWIPIIVGFIEIGLPLIIILIWNHNDKI